MKKLFIVALFATLLSNAQKEFQGTWLTPGSSYETIILANNDLVVDIISYSYLGRNPKFDKIHLAQKELFNTL